MPPPASLRASRADQDPTNLQYCETRDHERNVQEFLRRKGVGVPFNPYPGWIQDQESELIQSSIQDHGCPVNG